MTGAVTRHGELPVTRPGEKCVACGRRTDLTRTVTHITSELVDEHGYERSPGAYDIEPAWVCDTCRDGHEKFLARIVARRTAAS